MLCQDCEAVEYEHAEETVTLCLKDTQEAEVKVMEMRNAWSSNNSDIKPGTLFMSDRTGRMVFADNGDGPNLLHEMELAWLPCNLTYTRSR